MISDLNWIIGKTIEQVTYDDQSHQWLFTMAENTSLSVYCPWHIISEGHVALASADHGQQYGLASVIDAAIKATAILSRHRIKSIETDKASADLTILLNGDMLLRTFNDSSGYEAWHVIGPHGIEVVAQGGGKIIVFNESKKS